MFYDLETVEQVKNVIEEYKIKSKIIKRYEQAAQEGKLVISDKGYYRTVNLKDVFSNVNLYLKVLNRESISNVSELYSVLRKLQVRLLTVEEIVEESIPSLKISLESLKKSYDRIDKRYRDVQYYSGMSNCKRILVSVLNRAKNNGDVIFDAETGLVNDLSKFIADMFDDLENDVYEKTFVTLDKINGFGVTYSAKDEEQVFKDIKQAIETIPDSKRKIQLGIELMALENRHNNNVKSLRRIQVNTNDDIGNRALTLKPLIEVFKDNNDKEALRRLASNYDWYRREALTINEIIAAINKECEGKEQYIGSTLFENLQIEREKYKNMIYLMKKQNVEERLPRLKKEQGYLYDAIKYISYHTNLIDENNRVLKRAKDSYIQSHCQLLEYRESIKYRIKNQVTDEVKKLLGEMDDENRIKEILLSEKIKPEIIEKMTEKERYEGAIKYYLTRLNDIYLKAVRSYYTLPVKISSSIYHYDYKDNQESDCELQILDDIDDFFDQVKFELSKLPNRVISSKKITNEIINPDKSLSVTIIDLNPKFNCYRFDRKLELYKNYIASTIYDKISKPVVKLVPGIRDDETLDFDEKELKKSLMTGKKGARDILDLGRKR